MPIANASAAARPGSARKCGKGDQVSSGANAAPLMPGREEKKGKCASLVLWPFVSLTGERPEACPDFESSRSRRVTHHPCVTDAAHLRHDAPARLPRSGRS